MRLDTACYPEAFAQLDAEVFERGWQAGAFSEEQGRWYWSFWEGDVCAAYLVASEVCGEAELWRIAVGPSFRRKGLAARLVKLLQERCQAERVTRLFLEVSCHNHPAIKLYQRFDFQESGRRRNYYGAGEDALLMDWSERRMAHEL